MSKPQLDVPKPAPVANPTAAFERIVATLSKHELPRLEADIKCVLDALCKSK